MNMDAFQANGVCYHHVYFYQYLILPKGHVKCATLDDGKENPRNLKVRLAKEIIEQFYDNKAADSALEKFEQMFVKKEVPDDIEELLLPLGSEVILIELMLESKLVTSKSEARRLIQGGGVSINGERIMNEKAMLIPTIEGTILKVGKRKFLRVKSE